jgi:hypothetical protein
MLDYQTNIDGYITIIGIINDKCFVTLFYGF